MIIFMEININCDLGEKSEYHSTQHDPELLKIVNSANIACGFHAGDKLTMINTIEISKKITLVLERTLLLMILKTLGERGITYLKMKLKIL